MAVRQVGRAVVDVVEVEVVVLAGTVEVVEVEDVVVLEGTVEVVELVELVVLDVLDVLEVLEVLVDEVELVELDVELDVEDDELDPATVAGSDTSLIDGVVVSVAVTVCMPAVPKVAENERWPASAGKKE